MYRPLATLLLPLVLLSSCVSDPAPAPAPAPAPTETQPPALLGALRIDHDISDPKRFESKHPISVIVSARGVQVRTITVAPGKSYSTRLPLFDGGNYEYRVTSHATKVTPVFPGRFELTKKIPTYTISVSALKPSGEMSLLVGKENSQLEHGYSRLTFLSSENGTAVVLIPDPAQEFRDPEDDDGNGGSGNASKAVYTPEKTSLIETAANMLLPGIVTATVPLVGITAGRENDAVAPELLLDHVPTRIAIEANGTEVAIPETIILPSGKWTAVWKTRRQEFDLAPDAWIVVDYDTSPTTVRTVRD